MTVAQLSWHIELTIPDSALSSLKLQSQPAVESSCSLPSLLIFRTLFLDSSKKVLSPLCTTLVWVGLSWSLQGISSSVQPPQALSPRPGTPTAQRTAHLGKLGSSGTCCLGESWSQWLRIIRKELRFLQTLTCCAQTLW